MAYDSLPDHSPRFTVAPPGIVRMTCECCGFPTLSLLPDSTVSDVDWDDSHLACVLCSWESGPALDDGTPDPAAGSAEERNEGRTLAEAQANCARHAWMYDPAHPPEWMGGRPTPHELESRQALRRAYETLTALEPRARGEAWELVLALETELRAAEEERRAALEDTLEEQGALEDEDELPGA